MKKKGRSVSRVKFIAIIAVLIIAGFLLLNGATVGHYRLMSVDESINYGLDLTGGVYVVLEAEETNGEPVSDESMARTIATIRERVDSLGVSEPVIARQGDQRIRVSLPDIQDQQEALDLIGQTAQLEFIDPNGEVVITGEHVVSATAVYQDNEFGAREAVVALELNSDGEEAFAEATSQFTGEIIEIRLDGQAISTPIVNQPILDGEAIIQGMGNMEEAGNLAMLIQGGALPVDLSPVEIRTVGPTLGQDSLDKSILGGVLGISIVIAFMLIVYRAPGFIAGLSLSFYILLFLLAMSLLGFTLTLPGVAGIILSIGMAVDANVIIFERIKEELKVGKSLLASVDAGFKRAFTTVIDANVTTMIAGGVLFFLGSGSVKGFALTLLVGIVLSMFSSMVLTRIFMKVFIRASIITSKKMYGA
ncbi:MAG TPA: protein translocase subunit SecD [Eubacteriaceae bacterium]|nr:protein translocase subunit SecD [Eubacteriaceae bacterium]